MKQRFSIRKYHFGAASVLIGTTLFLMGGPSVLASELGTSQGTNTELISKTEKKTETPKEVVSKEKLQSLLSELKSLITEVSASKLGSVENQERIYQKADSILHENEATQESVNEQVSLVQNSIDSLKRLKEEKAQSKSNEETVGKKEVAEKEKAETVTSEGNKTVALTSDKVEKTSNVEEITNNSTNGVSSKIEKVETTIISSDSNKKKLEILAKNLDEYLKPASEITRPETKELLKGVEETVLAVKKGLENPQLNASEIEELVKQGKEAEKKLVLAVTREHSGKRDSLNGNKMLPESYFRASYYRAADGKVYDSHGDEHLTEATVGYITKPSDGSGYPPGTFLYISHNDNASANGRNNADLGPQPVKRLKNKVLAEVTKNSDGYHWKITYNNAHESRQNPIYYFTIPEGHSVRNMKLIKNGAVVKKGGVAQVFNGEQDDYLTAVGSPNSGVNGGSYYENVANVNSGIVGGRNGIYTLDDFVKNNTNVYFNRDGMTEEDIRVTDKLYEQIKSSTKNVFAFKPKGLDTRDTYEVEFDTVGDTESPLYYIAGMKSYEKVPSGRFMHKSYQQWYGVQERYNVTVNTNVLKTTFLKGTGIGTLDSASGLMSNAVTIEDTYNNNSKMNPGRGDVTDYYTYKRVGNESTWEDSIKRSHNKYTHIHNDAPQDLTADSTKGNHTVYIEAKIKGQKISFRLPFRVVTQSDIYQPVAKTVTDTKSYNMDLGDASTYITRYDNVSSSIPGFKTPDYDDMTAPNDGRAFYKDRISDFPTSSARIKEQAVKSVEWTGDSNDLTTGARVIELTVDGKKELFTVPSDIDVAPGRTISAENVKKLNDAIHETYKKIDTNGHEVDAAKVPKISSTTPVWVKKQIKVTYYDNENNARTNNQDDSVDYVDVLFKNIRKEATPTAPAISVPEDGSASVTPKGTTDKLVVSYRPTDQNTDTTITVKKSGTTWGTLDTLPNGVTVNPSNGVVSITEPTVKDLSTITAKATYLNSDEASATDTVKTPDNVAPTVSFNGKALTKDADATRFIIYRGANFNPTFKVQDNKNSVTLSITGLPKGVANVSTRGNKEFNYTITGDPVAADAPLEERTATVIATDSRNNTATYKFKYRVVDLQTSNSPAAPEVGDSLGDAHHYLKVAESNTRDTDDYYPTGMRFIWKEVNPRTIMVSDVPDGSKLNKIGKQTQYYATAVFPNSGINDKNITINNKSASYKIYSGTTVSKPVEFNVRPKKPTLVAEQFYGTAGTKPNVTVSNLPTNAQLQDGAKVTVELYQGTTKIASKTVSSGITSVNFENGDYNTNLIEGQQVHAVVKVTGGQGTTAYDVSSADSDNRTVTGRSRLSNLATDKLVVQVQDLANNRRGTLSEREKQAIKQAIFEANKNGVLKGKQVSDINISDTGLITALDKDNKIAELQIDPKTNVVTRFAHIRDDYNITFTNNGKPANRSTDPGFEWSSDHKSLIYKFDATSGVGLDVNEVLKTITATPKNPQNQPSLTTVTGNDKASGESNSNGFSKNATSGYFSKNGVGVNVLDLVNPTTYRGGGNIDNTTNKLVDKNRTGLNSSNVGTTLGNDSISAANGANAISLSNVVKKANGTDSLVVRKQLYLMPKYTNDQLLQDRGNTNANNTNVINVYFVPVDPTAPQVERSTSNTLATTSAQASRLADSTSFAGLAKVTDNYDKDDVTNPSSNTVRSKLNMWVKKGDTKVQIVENGVEKTAIINNLKKELDPATYEVIAKTTDASGNKSHADSAEGASLGFFKVGYDLVARETINVKQGERLTQDELNKLIQVQEGNEKVDLPQGATVTAALETNTITRGSEETKTVEATVDFGQGRTKKLNIRYRVLRTFPIANLVYDFQGQPRNDSELSYYTNTGLPQGMSWYVKKGTQTTNHGRIQEFLRADGLGTTEYTFGAKYNAGRFTNRPEDGDKLKHEDRLVHKVFDVMPNPTKITVDQGASLSDTQAKDAVIKVANSENLPEGTTYEWVNASGGRETARATTSGEQTFHVKITLPKSQVTGSDLPGATQVQPSKIIPVTVNVTPPKPTFDPTPVTSTSRTITGTLGGLNASAGKAVVRVALNDGSGRVLTSENNGGVTINGNTWTATLPNDVKLRQSVQKNGENVKPANLTVTTTIAGTQLSRQGDDKVVQMGSYAITPAIAGSKHIDITVPHDAKRVELRFHNSTETSNTPKSIVLVRGADGTWHTDVTRTNNTAVANANGYVGRISSTVSTTNPAENNIRIELNEQSGSTKLHIKEESANGDNTELYGSGLGLRVYNQPEAGQEPSATGKWKVANVTNTKPTLSHKGTEASNVDARKVFPSGTSITKEMLENLVTVGDTEDKVANEADKPYGTPTIKIVSGLTETPGNPTPAGRYTVVLKAVDSQGKESDPLTVYVGVVSTKVSYQPKVGGAPLGEAKVIPVDGDNHRQGESVNYTPESEIRDQDGKVYVPKDAGSKTVTLKDVPQTVEVEYVEKPASTKVSYQPKVGGAPLGEAKVIPVDGDNHRQGESVNYTPESEIRDQDGKVYVPKDAGSKTVTLKDVPQTVEVEYVEKPATSTPTFTVGTQNPQTGNVEVTVEGVPEGTKVKLPGITSEKVVTGGKVNLAHNELPENPTTGKGIAQEDGKLPKEGTSDITIPGKLTSAKGEPAREFEVEIPLPIVVPDPEHLTSKEIEKLVDKVKESNPNTIVTADDKGNVTVTDKTTGESVLIPAKDLTVKDFEPVKPTDKVPVKDKAHLTPEEKKQVADKVKAKNPGKEVTVGDDGTATVTDPTTGISHTIPGTELVNQDFEPVKPTEKVLVKDKAHLTPEEKKQVADKVKAKNPGKEVTVGDDGTVTVTDSTTGISHTIPATDLVIEFAKGDPTRLEVPGLIITKWTDEQGNDLKQSDAKAPSVPGEANEALEPGEIDGYVFVRTKVKGNIVTHIFRKVSSTETIGDNKPQSTPEVPTDNTEHKPETITPNEQTTETENPTAKPKASQNILPNTGTADGLGIFSTAVASILAGLGLFLPVKKEDEDEEETQKN